LFDKNLIKNKIVTAFLRAVTYMIAGYNTSVLQIITLQVGRKSYTHNQFCSKKHKMNNAFCLMKIG